MMLIDSDCSRACMIVLANKFLLRFGSEGGEFDGVMGLKYGWIIGVKGDGSRGGWHTFGGIRDGLVGVAVDPVGRRLIRAPGLMRGVGGMPTPGGETRL